MAGKKRKSESIRPVAELNHENPRFFRNLCDQGLVPMLTEHMRESLVAAGSKLHDRHGGIEERQVETVRAVTESKVADMFQLGRQVEFAREMSTKLEPCADCGSKVNFHFVSNPREPIDRGYVLCSGCKKTRNFRGSPKEIVDKWNNHAPGDRWD